MEASSYIKEILNNVHAKQVYLTKFLTQSEQDELLYFCGNKFNVYFDGGYDGAKLKRALISVFEVNDLNLKVVCCKVSASNKFYTLRHPTVKWHFFNMGINERMFGDIILVDEDFYVVMASEVYDTVIKETESINRCPVTFEIVNNVIVDDVKEEFKAFCSGLRIDNVIAKTFHLSRDKAQKLIDNERVNVNSNVVLKYTSEVASGDTINIKGYGKVIIKDICINNKSGKYIVNHNRFLRKDK